MNQTTGHDAPAFQLGDWRVEPWANCLRLNGREERVETRVMELLVYLAEHPGEVVRREQLERAIWRDRVVGYEALTNAVTKLRKVFDDDVKNPRYIETISKKGYRLIAPVSPITSTEIGKHSTRHLNSKSRISMIVWLGGLMLTTLATIVAFYWSPGANNQKISAFQSAGKRPAITVLPFTNLGQKNDGDYFSNGITADITTELSKFSGLLIVTSDSSVNRTTRGKLRRYAEKLGVRYVVHGSVRRGGDRLRINVTLVDAESSVVLWSENYDNRSSRVFELQDSIVRKIVDTLRVQLTEAEQQLTAHRYTTSIEAYDDFLRGQSFYLRYTRNDNLQAREFYQRALLRDDHFARAYSALALTYAAEHRYGWENAQPGSLDKALDYARKAIVMDDDLPQAHWTLAYIQVFRRNYELASRSAARAIELNPNFADSYLTLAVCRIHDGHPERAIELIRKAMLLNPKYPAAYASVLGQAHFYSHQYEQALPFLRDAIKRNPNLLAPQVFLIAALSKTGQADEAHWAADKLKIQVPDFRVHEVGKLLAIGHPGTISDLQQALRKAGLN